MTLILYFGMQIIFLIQWFNIEKADTNIIGSEPKLLKTLYIIFYAQEVILTLVFAAIGLLIFIGCGCIAYECWKDRQRRIRSEQGRW